MLAQAALNNRSQNLEPPPGKIVPRPQINSQQVLHLLTVKETRIGELILAH
jgi:hypothetical protein